MAENKTGATEAPKTRAPRDTVADFKRVGSKRVGLALEGIERVQKVSKTTLYTYTEEQVDKMEAALNQAVQNCIASFRAGLAAPKGTKGAARERKTWDF